MGRSELRRGIAALGLVLGMTAGTPMAVHAGGSGCTSGQWAVMPTPAVPASTVSAVLALSSTDVWVAGAIELDAQIPSRSATAGAELFEHWDGSQWSNVPGAGVPAGRIVALAGDASNDVWAFGSVGSVGASAASLVEHWDGQRWKVVTGATLPDSLLSSGVVLGPTDVWAYGRGPLGTQATTPGFLEHWNGTVWTVIPDVGQGYGEMAATSDTDIWVAGFVEVTHWTGGPLANSWGTASVNGSPMVAEGIADTGPGGLWISGYSGLDGANQTDVQTWTANGFTNTTVTNGPDHGVYYQMSAASSTDVWTVGTQNPRGTVNATSAAHWDGTQWTSIPPVNPSGTYDTLTAVSALPGQAWAVGETLGSSGWQPLIETYCA